MTLNSILEVHLDHLLAPHILNAEPTIPDVKIKGLVTDNRDVKAGDCFIALAGIHRHGKEFIEDAIARGANAILLEGESWADPNAQQQAEISYQDNIPVIEINNLKLIVNKILIDFYQAAKANASTVFDMRLLGVTGTNGKSSITRFVAQMSHGLNQTTGLMGTLGFGVWPNIAESKNTTPELAVLLRQFALMQAQGAKQVAMEVSSHGIEQKRIENLTFDSAVFSNLTQDHLDYHGDMENYFSIKRELFLLPGLRNAIINIDDEYGQRLLADDAISAKKISYGFSADADVRVVSWQTTASSISTSITTPWGDASFTINMVGDFNLANVLAAISLLAVEERFVFADIIESIKHITPAPGRMQTYVKASSATAVIDFAHTPDALNNVLTTLRKQTQGQLAVVFGCGGNRDAAKRPLMTQIAQSLADRIVLTADNPRAENLQTIIADMKTGLVVAESDTNVATELDRASAIKLALSALKEGDLLLIAGKGHEAYQDIAGTKIPYSDESTLLALGYKEIV